MVASAQYEALRKVNKELIELYWNIGKAINDKQGELGWGKSIVEKLARDLQAELPGVKGFSARNLWNMRNYFLEYRDNSFLQTLSAEISWSKNVLIMTKCKDSKEREFYISMTQKFSWTYDSLTNQVDAKIYNKYLNNQVNFESTLPEPIQSQAKLAVKDEYTFDFLELSEDYSEKELELGLLKNIRKFLLEMGGYFCFVANQYRLEVSNQEFFIDLLLYHRKLKSLVAIELKIGDFKPEYAGKMSFYLSALNDKMKLDDENSAIGIIICRTKDRTIVEYALKSNNQPIGVGTYSVQEDLPEELQKYLPSEKDLIDSIERFL
jgi:predicted nuclease of restriction endonuclease-like (RecB) superfamily